MGYDLHITRRRHWADAGLEISIEEWHHYVEADPELSLRADEGRPHAAEWNGESEDAEPWLDWSDGCIYTKNPDDALIDKMVAIAGALDAEVQGDDGEIYEGGGAPPRYRRPGPVERLAGWFSRLRIRRRPVVVAEPLPFVVGDRVIDAVGVEATVVLIDPEAEHGLGIVRVRRDNGTECSFLTPSAGSFEVLADPTDATGDDG